MTKREQNENVTNTFKSLTLFYTLHNKPKLNLILLRKLKESTGYQSSAFGIRIPTKSLIPALTSLKALLRLQDKRSLFIFHKLRISDGVIISYNNSWNSMIVYNLQLEHSKNQSLSGNSKSF